MGRLRLIAVLVLIGLFLCSLTIDRTFAKASSEHSEEPDKQQEKKIKQQPSGSQQPLQVQMQTNGESSKNIKTNKQQEKKIKQQPSDSQQPLQVQMQTNEESSKNIRTKQNDIEKRIADISNMEKNKGPDGGDLSAYSLIISIGTFFIAIAIVIVLAILSKKQKTIKKSIENNREIIIDRINNRIDKTLNRILEEISQLKLNLSRGDPKEYITHFNALEKQLSEIQLVLKGSGKKLPDSEKTQKDNLDGVIVTSKRLNLDKNGKLEGYDPKAVRYEVKVKRESPGFAFIEKFFIENANGNYIIVPDSHNPNTGICYPLDATKLDQGDNVYPVSRSDTNNKEWKLQKLAKCKKENGQWKLDGDVGKIIGPSPF